MSFKDCLYGQVRKLNGYPELKCTDLPNDVSTIIGKQEVITWDNTTGMNPLYDSLPTDTLLSYGEMLATAWDMDSIWLKQITNGDQLDPEEYEARIMEDYSNEFTLLSKRLALWWFTDCFLNREDVLDYDFVIIRQVDTLWNPHCNARMVFDEMGRSNQKVFNNYNIPEGIPVCYDLSMDMNRRHPSATMLTSHAFILNREAVKILKDNFFRFSLHEVDFYYTILGSNNFLNGDPGGIMHKICIKNDVESVSLREVFLRPEFCRGGEKGGKVDYSNLDRTGV
jgi:hypothetical protein